MIVLVEGTKAWTPIESPSSSIIAPRRRVSGRVQRLTALLDRNYHHGSRLGARGWGQEE